MQITLRPYQQRTIDECVNALRQGKNALIKAPTGSGKSIMLAEIAKEIALIILSMSNSTTNMRCCLLIDRETLVRQLADTFKNLTGLSVGICCASVDKKVDLDKTITIASRQTLANQMHKMPFVHLVICDEAHLVPLHPSNSQYAQILDKFKEYNPQLRLLGCTASPWRMDSGYIFGDKHRYDLIPWFSELTSSITFEELFKQNHLCPLRGLVANYKKPDLSQVGKVGNEYNLGELSTAMCKYVDTVNDAIEEHLQDHNHILVFACTIEHCEELKKVIPNSETLHSKSKEPLQVLEDFKNEKFRVLISVNKLSIGFDFPPASALVLARPTMSSALYLQIVGRVLRTHESKTEAVLIDLTENTNTHCPSLDLDKIYVKIPPMPGGGVAPVKFCEAEVNGMMCYAENHPSVVYCVECGAKFPEKTIPEEYMPDLKAVAFQAVEPEWYPVNDMAVEEHTSKNNGKRLLRVQLKTGDIGKRSASEWICTASDYSGFAVTEGRKKWELFSDEDFPEDLDMALWVANSSFHKPSRMLCSETSEGYLNIVKLDFGEVEAVASGEDSFFEDEFTPNGELIPF